MIRHIVLFGVKRSEDIPTVVEALETFRNIPVVQELEVSLNDKHDSLSSEIDVVLHGIFNSKEELEMYKGHDIYRAGIEVVRPLRDKRIVVDYEC